MNLFSCCFGYAQKTNVELNESQKEKDQTVLPIVKMRSGNNLILKTQAIVLHISSFLPWNDIYCLALTDRKLRSFLSPLDKKIVNYLKQMADAGAMQAKSNIGILYFKGVVYPQSDENAKFYLNPAAKNEFAEALYYLALLREKEKKFDEEIDFYAQAADRGHLMASFKLGMCFFKGEKVAQSYEKAMNRLLVCANNGFTEAQYSVGTMFYEGNPKKSIQLATKFLKLAADKGHPAAQCQFAIILFEQGAYLDSSRYFHDSTKQKNIHAHYCLGNLFALGKGVKKSYSDAANNYKIAADNGHAEAQFIFGIFLREGKGVKQDEQAGIRYWKLAERQGHVQAHRNLIWLKISR